MRLLPRDLAPPWSWIPIGQHPADNSQFHAPFPGNSGAIILGQPQFGRDAPRARVAGHFLANF